MSSTWSAGEGVGCGSFKKGGVDVGQSHEAGLTQPASRQQVAGNQKSCIFAKIK